MSMRTALTVGALAAVLAGCGQSNTYVAPPPPKVTVATPLQQLITRYLELTGSTAAVNSADLTARVPGFVQEVNYADGALVKEGTLLFTIEPEPYEVKLQQAQAAEAGALSTARQSSSPPSPPPRPPATRRWRTATPRRPTMRRRRPTRSSPPSTTTTRM
jgi:multidrug efflux pump subunit AcrA (membrane-fusion protein)